MLPTPGGLMSGREGHASSTLTIGTARVRPPGDHPHGAVASPPASAAAPPPHRGHRTAASARRPGLPARISRRAVTALVGLAGLAVLALGPTGLALGWHEQAQRADREAPEHLLGAEVRDGPATFVVHEVRCGDGEDTVHGQRCLATVAVRNDGDARLTIPGQAQVLHGPDGVRHLPVDGNPMPFGVLPPGESATTVIEFDLPSHAMVTHVGVHADVYSEGVPVSLGGPPLPLPPGS